MDCRSRSGSGNRVFFPRRSSKMERGRGYVEEQAHGGADDRGAEAVRGGAQSGRCGAGGGRVEAHHLCLESKVRRDGCERGAGGEAIAGREYAVEKASGGSKSRQRDAEMLKAVIAKNGWSS